MGDGGAVPHIRSAELAFPRTIDALLTPIGDGGKNLLLGEDRGDLLCSIAIHSHTDGDCVPHRVLDNEHPRIFQVFAQALDVKADQPVADVHRGAVVEEVEGAVDIQRVNGWRELCLRCWMGP